jgi:hypothetical protein
MAGTAEEKWKFIRDWIALSAIRDSTQYNKTIYNKTQVGVTEKNPRVKKYRKFLRQQLHTLIDEAQGTPFFANGELHVARIEQFQKDASN